MDQGFSVAMFIVYRPYALVVLALLSHAVLLIAGLATIAALLVEPIADRIWYAGDQPAYSAQP
jgi:hypothetical protein